MTNIEWTDMTWNTLGGCTKVGPGCDNCYAAYQSVWQEGLGTSLYRGVAERINGHYEWTGKITFASDEVLAKPLHIKRPHLIFVNSMSDLFHKNVPRDFRDRVYDVMEHADWHIFQVLTKRSTIMRDYVNRRYRDREPPKHIWHGITCENSDMYSRIEHLQKTKSAIRFLSLEPLLSPLPDLPLDGIHQAIVGGESGPFYRDMDDDWAREIRDQCQAQGVAFFFKQRSGKNPKKLSKELDGRTWLEYPIDMTPYQKGKAMTPAKLSKIATKAKDLIKEAEAGRVEKYVAAGEVLLEAKAGVRKAKLKWGEWLVSNGIPQRTASRAMRYAKDPEKYRQDRMKDALEQRLKRIKIGQTSGQKRALLKVLQAATDSEIDALYRLMEGDRTLKKLIPEKYKGVSRINRAA